MEKNFVTASMAYNRDYTIFFRRPISLVILILTVLLLVSLMKMNKKIEELNKKQMEEMQKAHEEI
jgi:putative tricarboxylic transport membrane protein